jgi:hypothetical protein
MKTLMALSLLLLLNACSLPGSDLTTTPDETTRELRDPKYLKGVYDQIKGEYPMLLVDADDRSNSRCVVFEIDYKTVKDGHNSRGEPILSYQLTGTYTDIDSFVNEEVLIGRYYEQGGNVSFLLESASNSRSLEISGKFRGNKLVADLKMKGYAAGDLRASVISETTCPNKVKTQEQLSLRLEKLFNGTWVSEQVSQTGKPFHGEMRLDVVRMPSGPSFSLNVVGNYTMVTPDFKYQPVPVSAAILLNQKPVSVVFKPKEARTVAPEFYGYMVDAQTIQGTAVFPAFATKLTFKKVGGNSGDQDQDQK